MERVFNLEKGKLYFDTSKGIKVIAGDKTVYLSPARMRRIQKFVFRRETMEMYGLAILQGQFCIISRGEFITLRDYLLSEDDYNHDWKPESRPFLNSGIEVEVDNEYSAHLLESIMVHLGVSFTPKYDSSVFREYTMKLEDYIYILPHIKPSINIVSTHLHFSCPLAFDIFEKLDLIYIEPLLFGRNFNEYATCNKEKEHYDRYAAITFPRYLHSRDSILVLANFYDDNVDRVTIEFRLPAMKNLWHLRNLLLLFLDKIHYIKNKREIHNININQIEYLIKVLDKKTEESKTNVVIVQCYDDYGDKEIDINYYDLVDLARYISKIRNEVRAIQTLEKRVNNTRLLKLLLFEILYNAGGE